MRAVIGVALFLGLVAPAQGQTLEDAHRMIADEMRDPESTRFRNTYIVEKYDNESGVSVCGEFNTKNAMGGYDGYKPFYALVITHKSVNRAVVTTTKIASLGFIEKKCVTEPLADGRVIPDWKPRQTP